jgi:CBS domain-containing protein
MPHDATPDALPDSPDADPGNNPSTGASATLARISDHVRRITERVAGAATVAELRVPAQQADILIETVHRRGIGVGLITELVCELNAQLLARLWSMIAPPELMRNSCLMVMGSEGRGEQTLKTDQDNGLLLRDGFQFDGLGEIADAFTAALLDFGYPLCPGGIMVRNPHWRQHQSEFKQTVRRWCYDSAPDGVMQLAILLDARAIAGDAELLDEAKSYLWSIVPDSDAFLARFASPVGQFDHAGGGWWHWLTQPRDDQDQFVDLKKSGSFQIVHGVRALSLKHHVAAVSTRDRLAQLVEHHGLPPALARDLLDALDVLIGLKLDHHLRLRRLGRPADNLVSFRDLATLEHAKVDSAMAVVKAFRQHLQLHCPFDML